jgi:hypothetical protein
VRHIRCDGQKVDDVRDSVIAAIHARQEASGGGMIGIRV